MGRRTGQRRPLFLGVLRVDGDEYLGHMDRALFTIAMVQARWDSQGSAYLARKRAEGKTASEARRCLMRHLAGVVYRAMITDAAARQQLPSSGAA